MRVSNRLLGISGRLICLGDRYKQSIGRNNLPVVKYRQSLDAYKKSFSRCTNASRSGGYKLSVTSIYNCLRMNNRLVGISRRLPCIGKICQVDSMTYLKLRAVL